MRRPSFFPGAGVPPTSAGNCKPPSQRLFPNANPSPDTTVIPGDAGIQKILPSARIPKSRLSDDWTTVS